MLPCLKNCSEKGRVSGRSTPASKSIPEDPPDREEQGRDCTGRPGAPEAAGAKASQTPTLSICNLLALVLRSLI